MKVIFIQTIAGVARKDDVREVSDGYALNYLFPKKLAIRASETVLAAAQRRQEKEARSATEQVSVLQQTAVRLKGQVVAVPGRAADTGKLYAAITPAEVARAITTVFGVSVTGNQVTCLTPLKSLGEHTITLRLGPGVTTTMTVRVVAQ